MDLVRQSNRTMVADSGSASAIAFEEILLPPEILKSNRSKPHPLIYVDKGRLLRPSVEVKSNP